MSLHLSKSRFCSAIQCPKMLWLKLNKPEEFDDSLLHLNTDCFKASNAVIATHIPDLRRTKTRLESRFTHSIIYVTDKSTGSVRNRILRIGKGDR